MAELKMVVMTHRSAESRQDRSRLQLLQAAQRTDASAGPGLQIDKQTASPNRSRECFHGCCPTVRDVAGPDSQMKVTRSVPQRALAAASPWAMTFRLLALAEVSRPPARHTPPWKSRCLTHHRHHDKALP